MNNSTTKSPFAEFFELGHQESVSPFLEPSTRRWSENLTIKASLLAAGLLLISFPLTFINTFAPLAHFLLLTVYFLAGIPSLIEAVEDLLEGDVNIDILMTLAAFSSVFIGSGFEGALLLVLFALSGSMEDAVTAKAKGSLSSLHKLSPTKACVIQSDGTLIERAVADVPLNTQILVRPGEIVPMDGRVIAGTSSVNLVHLTGENFPVTKAINDDVPTGARNLDGVLTIEVTRTSTDSTLAKIIQLVTQAQDAKPALQRWFDKVSKRYAITIILLSALFAISFPYLLSIPFLGVEGSIYRALSFLIAASPCALIIAIPIAYLSAVSACAKKGILLKGGLSLDALHRCTTIAFDKTGTLTTGELTCTSFDGIVNDADSTENNLFALSTAYALERNAVHPVAQAIIKYIEGKKLIAIELDNFHSVPGQGLEAVVSQSGENKKVYLGRPAYILNHLLDETRIRLQKMIDAVQARGELLAVLFIEGVGNQQIYLFSFRDTPRSGMEALLKGVDARGLHPVMLTGDHFASAKRVADELGIKEFHADLTPADKLRYVTEMADKRGLAMIGDGVNDAPALARATVGLSMGAVGSASAIEAADIVFLHDNIEMLTWLIDKATQTRRIVSQNLFVAAAAILIASLPALAGVIPLWVAVVMHEGGTILVGLNALRLFRT